MLCRRTGKRRYPDKHTAKVNLVAIRAADILRRHGRAKTPVRVYRCEFCRDWHTTSKPYIPRKPPPEESPS